MPGLTDEERQALSAIGLRLDGDGQAWLGETAADAMRLAADRPDLIVLDVRLPDGSGFDLARSFKTNPDTADIPLLLISASFTSPNERAKGLDAGADGYLTHPVEPPVLLATVRALLRSREAEMARRESEARFRSMADSAPVSLHTHSRMAICRDERLPVSRSSSRFR